MTANPFQKATKSQLKARVALDGPSGAGKTWTALEWAGVLAGGGQVAVVDTEHGSASLYADTFDFDVLTWAPPYDPGRLADTIRTAQKNGYQVLVIDSLSHFWEGEGGTRDIVDAAAERAKGNTFAGWKVGTPALRNLIDTMLAADLHVIATMRSKMEYVLETDGRGKQVPKKVGMAPVMRAGVEYEFTLVGDLDLEHRIVITKSRCSALADTVVQPGRAAEAAEAFMGWLNEGEPAEPAAEFPADALAAFGRLPAEAAAKIAGWAKVEDLADAPPAIWERLVGMIARATEAAEAPFDDPDGGPSSGGGGAPTGDGGAPSPGGVEASPADQTSPVPTAGEGEHVTDNITPRPEHADPLAGETGGNGADTRETTGGVKDTAPPVEPAAAVGDHCFTCDGSGVTGDGTGPCPACDRWDDRTRKKVHAVAGKLWPKGQGEEPAAYDTRVRSKLNQILVARGHQPVETRRNVSRAQGADLEETLDLIADGHVELILNARGKPTIRPRAGTTKGHAA